MQKEQTQEIEKILHMAEILLEDNLLNKKSLSEFEKKINSFLETENISKQYFKRLF